MATKLKKGDVIQWFSPKGEDGKPTGTEMVLEVERVDSEQETVYLNIVEQHFTDLSKQVTTRKKTGTKTLSIEEAEARKRRHEAINKPKQDGRRYTDPDQTFSFGVDDEASAEAAAKHWGYVRAVRIKTLGEDLKEAKKLAREGAKAKNSAMVAEATTAIVNALTELAKYQRLTPQNRRLLASAMQQEELARLTTR